MSKEEGEEWKERVDEAVGKMGAWLEGVGGGDSASMEFS